MSRYVSAIFVRMFVLRLGLTFFWSGLSNAAGQVSYRIPFFSDGTRIEFSSKQSEDGDGVRAYLTGIREAGSIFVDLYEAEGGVTPEIKSVFVTGKNPNKLFIIVAWAADNPSIGAGGSVYQVFVYDERIEQGELLPKLKQDTGLTNRFGVGFDGTRDRQPLTYIRTHQR